MSEIFYSKPVVSFACVECDRQSVSPLRVMDFLRGWDYLMQMHQQQVSSLTHGANRNPRKSLLETYHAFLKSPPAIGIGGICKLAELVEPSTEGKLRVVPVTIRGRVQGVDPENIHHALNQLTANGDKLSPEEFYIEFQRIHPLTDGNGRVGALLYNYRMHNLRAPKSPPDVFKEG